MLAALIILFFIFGGLAIYVYYSTRYFNDLYGKDSILTSKQIVTLDKRFSPSRVYTLLGAIFLFILGISTLSTTLINEFWNSEFRVVSLRIFIFIFGLLIATVSVAFVLIFFRLREINDNEYIFDPTEKSLTINEEFTFTKDDIKEFQLIDVPRHTFYFYRIILDNGQTIILTQNIHCFDVITEFFGVVNKKYYQYNIFKFIYLIYKEDFIADTPTMLKLNNTVTLTQ